MRAAAAAASQTFEFQATRSWTGHGSSVDILGQLWPAGAPSSRRRAGRGTLFEFAHQARQAVGQRLGAQLLAQPLDQQRLREQGRLLQVAVQRFERPQAGQHGAQPAEVEFLFEHFPPRLRQQQVAGVVAAEDFAEQAARRLQLAGRLRLAGIALEDEAGDAGDLAETPLRQLAGIQARQHVVEQPGVARQAVPRIGGVGPQAPPVEIVGRQQLETVVVGGDRERRRPAAPGAIGEQRGQPEVGQPTGEALAADRRTAARRRKDKRRPSGGVGASWPAAGIT